MTSHDLRIWRNSDLKDFSIWIGLSLPGLWSNYQRKSLEKSSHSFNNRLVLLTFSVNYKFLALLLLSHEGTSWMNLSIFQVSTIIHCSPGYIIYAGVTQHYTADDFRARTQLRGACPTSHSSPISMQPGLMEAQVSIGGTIRPDWRQAAHATLWPSAPPQMAWEQSESPGEPGVEQRATVCPAYLSLEVVLCFCLRGKRWAWFKALCVHCSTWSR